MTKPYICKYCNHGYSRESTLAHHICEQKRRALAKTEKHVMIGFEAYIRFYKHNQNMTHQITYEEFSKSPFYTAFIKFGSFVNNVNPLYPYNFIDYVVKSGTKLDHWCRDELYDKYVINLLKTENVETALERSISHMLKWADTTGSEWNHYFNEVSVNRATYDIKDGKVSPWLILNSNTGQGLLQKLNDEQLASITTVIDPQFWMFKFKKLPNDLAVVKQVIKESNL
jgi:hypothetical protein